MLIPDSGFWPAFFSVGALGMVWVMSIGRICRAKEDEHEGRKVNVKVREGAASDFCDSAVCFMRCCLVRFFKVGLCQRFLTTISFITPPEKCIIRLRSS
ncbi:MAG: hypothetical protein ABI286_10205 [Edaphobacter sp.]